MNQTGMEIVRPDFLPVSVSLISRDRESRSFRASFDGGLLVMQISFSVRPKHAWAKAHFHGRFFPRASRLAPRTEAPGLPPVGVNGRYVTANRRALTPLAESASCFGITVMRKDLFGNYVVKYRLLAMKERPNCEVVNPDSAERCDCGYNFVSDPMRSTNSAARRAIRAVLKGIAGV